MQALFLSFVCMNLVIACKDKEKKITPPSRAARICCFCKKKKKKVRIVVNQNLKTNQKISPISLEKIPKQFLVLSSRCSELQITCVLCSALNLTLEKVHSCSNKNLSYKNVIRRLRLRLTKILRTY